MKKIFSLLVGLAIIFSFAAVYASVKLPVGTYQCAICGVIEKVLSPSTVLDETDILGDGHRHDWRYTGGTFIQLNNKNSDKFFQAWRKRQAFFIMNFVA